MPIALSDIHSSRTADPDAPVVMRFPAVGDLVLLTVLQSFFEPDVTSSEFAVVPCPTIDGHGQLTPRPDGRRVRVFTRIDTRVMFEDMFTKIEFFDRWLVQSGPGA